MLCDIINLLPSFLDNPRLFNGIYNRRFSSLSVELDSLEYL